MAATFLQAMVELYDSAIGSPELWEGEEPETDELPFAFIIHQGETPTYTSCGDTGLTTARATFRLFDNSLAAVEARYFAIRDAFTPAALSIDGFPLARLFRELYTVGKVAGRDPNAEPVYRAEIRYRALF